LVQLVQNRRIDEDGVERFETMKDLDAAIERGEMVPIPVSAALTVDKRLDPKRRYVRPWTARFLTSISEQFYAQFHQPLMVDSAVRPMDVQKKLRRRNRNAAPVDGETASSHEAGLTIDLARSYMTPGEVKWMEIQLLILHSYGAVEVIEEHHQLCFHIMVAKKYDDPERVTVTTSVIDTQLPEEPNVQSQSAEPANPSGPLT
jgi:hypothetical protein